MGQQGDAVYRKKKEFLWLLGGKYSVEEKGECRETLGYRAVEMKADGGLKGGDSRGSGERCMFQ